MKPSKPGAYWWEDTDGQKHVAEFDSLMETPYWFGPDGILDYGTVDELEDQVEFHRWIGSAHPPKKVECYFYREGHDFDGDSCEDYVLRKDVQEFLLEDKKEGCR